MGSAIVVVILLVVVVFAFIQSRKHMKGEGGCCGGGQDEVASQERKKLDNPVIGRKTLSIEGMHCDNCKNSVERSINRLDGASAVVDLKKNIAIVDYDRELDDAALKIAVERLDFKLLSIKDEKLS
ncbi:heavy-metal-associated domain-containing protein [Lachnospira multipara]|uniref:heavy-metal-associated domain-containing protein n=1 Tax=Lachnospira multipara TaxID=28051 RepID=UPI0004098A40|nr:heavy metal-associated domain-containing protein [Lachnospira multipara]